MKATTYAQSTQTTRTPWPDCGHTAPTHEGHVDTCTMVTSITPMMAMLMSMPWLLTGQTLRRAHLATSAAHDASHVRPRVRARGHPHGDHIDYLVDGHLHHAHGDHHDDHGPVQLA